MAVAEINPRAGDLTCLLWIICFLDVVCKAVTTDMDALSALVVGPHLSSAKIALLGGGGGGGGGISSQKAPFNCSKHFCKVGETSTCVQFLLGFWLIYDVVIQPPDRNTHSQSTGVKEIFENPTCCWISCW